jgi:5-methyltetrahydropteroyltriglutamate--homocysteine methyltransferase
VSDIKTIRTDVIGSLLRPKALIEARKRLDEGTIKQDEFRAIEDDAVRQQVVLQESVGLDVLTDGEMRRVNFQDSFSEAVDGYDQKQTTIKENERRVEGAAPGQRWEVPKDKEAHSAVSQRRPVRDRIKLKRNVPLIEYEFLSKVAKKASKVSLIGVDRISQRFDYEASTGVYKSMDEFVDDVVKIEHEIVQSLVKAGCRYVHIDAPGFTAYVDEPSLAKMRARGEDPEANLSRSIKAEAKVVEGLGDVACGIHLCRGNQRSMWHREGAYDAIAERLFNELPHNRFMLEYDTPRAGSFEPLRFVPKGKIVVLGLVSTKTSEMETVEGLQRRIEEASKFLPLDQLAISPQCGFASDVVGNLLSIDDQRRKLELVVETARRVWR